MVQVLSAGTRNPSVGQRLAGGFERALESGSEMYQSHQQSKLQEQQYEQENEFAKEMGIDISGIRDPKQRQQIVASALQGNRQQEQNVWQAEQNRLDREAKGNELSGKANKENLKANEERNQKLQGFESALNSINQMKQLRVKGNLGRGSSIFGLAGGETARDIGEYETLGNSLIQYATNIPIRNRVEFEKLAGRISDPSTTDAEAEGILNALEQIIEGSAKQYMQGNEKFEIEEPKENKVLDTDAMQKIYKLAKGDKNEAKRIAKKMGYKIE